MTDKLERDGCVAVLVSPQFGGGWSTWNTELGEAILFSPELCLAVLGEKGEHMEVAQRLFPDAYHGGVRTLQVVWVKKGRQFRIEEYDGSEDISFNDDDTWTTA